jgi:hypothetical protein
VDEVAKGQEIDNIINNNNMKRICLFLLSLALCIGATAQNQDLKV